MRSFHIWAAVFVGTSGWIIATGCESDETTPTGATSTNVSNVASTTTSTTTTTAQGGNPGTGGMGQGGGQGGGPEGPCGEVCLNGGEPGQGCLNCVTTNCNAEFTACVMDMGAGGGGVGGGIGVGGAGGGGPCLSCAAVAAGGDPSNVCPESQALLDALFLCVCGDPATPGMCN